MSTTGLKLSRTSATPPSAAILADFAELTKPGITFMVALTCIAGFYMDSVEIEPAAMLATAVGTSLLAAGASTVNQYIERSLDGLMIRTRNRPLPDGRLSPGGALRFGIALSVTSVVVLLFLVDALPAMLGFVTFLTNIFLYTPLKRRTPFCTAVGAISGAMPPLIGSTAARGHIDLLGLTLFAVLLLWQMPHFLAIGWNYGQ